MRKSAFTLIELLIVITIIGLTATFSVSAWRSFSVKAGFDDAVNEVVAIFQDARSYAMKNAEVVGEDGTIYENSYYIVESVSDEITLSGYESGDIYSNSWEDLLSFDCGGNWSVTYTAPYADFTILTGGDSNGNLSCTITSTRGDLIRNFTVKASSGIAEVTKQSEEVT